MSINRVATLTANTLGLVLLATSAAMADQSSVSQPMPVIELRQYTLQPDKVDTFIPLFETQFIEPQEAVGMKVVGHFRDLDHPDRFVWMRGFRDMPARGEALNAFYFGPVWQEHRGTANPMIVDSDNVLLLHAASPNSGFAPDERARPPKGAAEPRDGLVIVNIYYFNEPVGPEFVKFFDSKIRPQLQSAKIPVLATFVTETTPNNFPRLPVREKDCTLVWVSRYDDQAAYERKLAALAALPGWQHTAASL